jgi:putative redox protein
MVLVTTQLDPLHQQSGQRWFHLIVEVGAFMQGTVEWTGGENMVGINSNGQRIEMNWEEGPSPMQLALQMVGACSIVDVVIGLKDREFSKVWVDMESTRNDESPRYFTSMHLVYHVVGDVPQKLVERVVHKSHEKYCSVSNSLRDDCKITSEVIIHSNHE